MGKAEGQSQRLKKWLDVGHAEGRKAKRCRQLLGAGMGKEVDFPPETPEGP